MHERGRIMLHIGLFNINKLIFAVHRLEYNIKTSLKYATLAHRKLNIGKIYSTTYR